MSRLGLHAVLLVGIGFGLGCSSSPTNQSTSAVNAYVFGTVLTSSGMPVVGATVAIHAEIDSPNGLRPYAAKTASTDDKGRYHMILSAPQAPPADAQLTIEVSPPSGAALQPVTVRDQVARFRDAFPPADSLEVNVTLTP